MKKEFILVFTGVVLTLGIGGLFAKQPAATAASEQVQEEIEVQEEDIYTEPTLETATTTEYTYTYVYTHKATTTYKAPTTTTKKASSTSGYYLATLDNQTNIPDIGGQLQLFIGNSGTSSYSVSTNYKEVPPTWTSFQPEIATVDETGLVTAVSPGTATIAAVVNDRVCSISITVSAAEETTIATEEEITERTTAKKETTVTTTQNPQIVTINNTRLLTDEQPQLQLYLLNAAGKSVTWSSFSPDILTVDENGLVTSHATGKAAIGVMIEDQVYHITLYVTETSTTMVESSSTLTATTTKKGDIDGDGIVSVEDAVLVLQYYAKQAAGLNPTWEELVG